LQIVDHPFGPLSSVAYMVQTIFLPFRELAYEPALGVWLSFDRLAAATVILMLLIALVIRRRRELRNVALFWCGWALVTIAPTANIIQQQAPYSERYIFLATLAVLAVAAAVVSSLPSSGRMRTGTALIGFAIVAVAAVVTIERGRCFENTLTFSRQWAKTSPDFGEAQMALGIELYQRGRIDEAVECFNQGIGTQPEARNFCRMWLGKMRLVQGRYAEAEALFQRLIEQEPRAPYTYYLSGVADRGLNEPDAAVARFQRAMEISPQSAGALFLLAKTLQEQGQASASQDNLARAASLTDLDLGFSDIRDADVQTLSGLSDLRYILLESTSITDEALRHLQGMRSLHRLWIPGTRITDAGLAYLADLPELNSLVLMNTQITDEGVAFLVKMKSLGHLDVRYTKLSREGLTRLKHELPECLILYEEPQ